MESQETWCSHSKQWVFDQISSTLSVSVSSPTGSLIQPMSSNTNSSTLMTEIYEINISNWMYGEHFNFYTHKILSLLQTCSSLSVFDFNNMAPPLAQWPRPKILESSMTLSHFTSHPSTNSVRYTLIYVPNLTTPTTFMTTTYIQVKSSLSWIIAKPPNWSPSCQSCHPQIHSLYGIRGLFPKHHSYYIPSLFFFETFFVIEWNILLIL